VSEERVTTTRCDTCRSKTKDGFEEGWRHVNQGGYMPSWDYCPDCWKDKAPRSEFDTLLARCVEQDAEIAKLKADLETQKRDVISHRTALGELHALVERTVGMLRDAGVLLREELFTTHTLEVGTSDLIDRYRSAVAQVEHLKDEAADTANYEEAYRVEVEKNRIVAELNADLQKTIAADKNELASRANYIKALETARNTRRNRALEILEVDVIEMLGRKRTKRFADALRKLLDEVWTW
jgi:hypothetical protein